MIDPLIVWQQLGITDYESNAAYRATLLAKGIEPADIALLDPDEVDLAVFWTHAPNLDDSSIAGAGHTRLSIHDINRFNRRIVEISGALGWLQFNANTRTFEIGPGYGSFYELVPAFASAGYIGVDAVTRFERVVPAFRGLPPEMLNKLKGRFNYVVSFNAFQHFSDATKRQYVMDAIQLLGPGGLFILNASVVSAIPNEYNLKDAANNIYIYTAGQLVRLWHTSEYEVLVQDCAPMELVGWQGYHGISTMIFRKG
jgi:SAM-dependent methyltransferase